MSVRLTTPDSRADMLELGSEEALTEGLEESDARGGCCGGGEKGWWEMKLCADDGVGGADGEGDGESTIHILSER